MPRCSTRRHSRHTVAPRMPTKDDAYVMSSAHARPYAIARRSAARSSRRVSSACAGADVIGDGFSDPPDVAMPKSSPIAPRPQALTRDDIRAARDAQRAMLAHGDARFSRRRLSVTLIVQPCAQKMRARRARATESASALCVPARAARDETRADARDAHDDITPRYAVILFASLRSMIYHRHARQR